MVIGPSRLVRRVTAGLAFLTVTAAPILVSDAVLATSHRQGDLVTPAAIGQQRASGRVPVLGAKGYMAPYGDGWGTYAPKRLFNGGSPGGLATGIVWRDWGTTRARGVGNTPYNLPEGGYEGTVKIRLRAQDLGSCRPGSKLAYRVLWGREQRWPGGPMGSWFRWAGDSTVCHRD